MQIWATGDPSKADDIFAKDAHLYNLIYGSKQVGVDAFKKMIHGVFEVLARLLSCYLLELLQRLLSHARHAAYSLLTVWASRCVHHSCELSRSGSPRSTRLPLQFPRATR